MKHLTIEQYNNIVRHSFDVTTAIRGCRNKLKEQQKIVVDLVKRESNECKTLPKEYRILYTYTGNCGTKKWADTYDAYNYVVVNDCVDVKETEKSIIIKHGCLKTVLSKKKIICYVW